MPSTKRLKKIRFIKTIPSYGITISKINKAYKELKTKIYNKYNIEITSKDVSMVVDFSDHAIVLLCVLYVK